MRVALIILTFIFSSQVPAQKNKPDDPIHFFVSCGIAGYTSDEIKNFKKQSHIRDSASFKRKLFEGSETEQVLSAILIKYYSSKGLILLSHNEKGRLLEIINSKKRFELCFTCTFHEEGTVKELFNEKKQMRSYEVLRWHLLDK